MHDEHCHTERLELGSPSFRLETAPLCCYGAGPLEPRFDVAPGNIIYITSVVSTVIFAPTLCYDDRNTGKQTLFERTVCDDAYVSFGRPGHLVCLKL